MSTLDNVLLAGPESEPYNVYSVVAPAPGDPGTGGDIAHLWIRSLGTKMVLEDGRTFRFASAGGSTLTVGSFYTSAVQPASQQNLTAAAGAVGDRIATMTTGASSAINTFAEGFLTVSVAPGAGQLYKIAGHAVMTSGAGDIVRLAPGHAIRVATSTASKYDLIMHRLKNVVIAPATTLAAAAAGVALAPATTTQGTWLQTRGEAAVLGSGTNIAGTRGNIGVGSGAISPETATAATSKLEVTVGVIIFAAATAAWSTVFLTID